MKLVIFLWWFFSFFDKSLFIEKKLQKITTTTCNMRSYLKCLFSYLEYFQIWQNIFMDGHHLKNITKLGGGGRKEKKNKNWNPFFDYILQFLKTILPNLVSLEHFFHINHFYLVTLKTFCWYKAKIFLKTN